MSPMTPALINYWHRLPAESPAARLKALDAVRARVHAGIEAHSVLVTFALGDVDEEVVVSATRAYVAGDPGAVAEATEWVRRGLALNRGAVFGALLGLEEESIVERLAALRLVLSAAEVEDACRALGDEPGPLVLAFLREWADLLADGPLLRERRALCAVLARAARAQAA